MLAKEIKKYSVANLVNVERMAAPLSANRERRSQECGQRRRLLLVHVSPVGTDCGKTTHRGAMTIV